MPVPDAASFRRLMGCFTTGVAVATTQDPAGQPIGLTINSLTSVSLNPPLLLFCLDRAAHVFPAFELASDFAINILAADQAELSRSFADFRHFPQPAGIWAATLRNCPILTGTLGWLLCRKTATYDGGDHVILLGEVMDLSPPAAADQPLAYFQGRYRRLAD